jgi:hypothetical protein
MINTIDAEHDTPTLTRSEFPHDGKSVFATLATSRPDKVVVPSIQRRQTDHAVDHSHCLIAAVSLQSPSAHICKSVAGNVEPLATYGERAPTRGRRTRQRGHRGRRGKSRDATLVRATTDADLFEGRTLPTLVAPEVEVRQTVHCRSTCEDTLTPAVSDTHALERGLESDYLKPSGRKRRRGNLGVEPNRQDMSKVAFATQLPSPPETAALNTASLCVCTKRPRKRGRVVWDERAPPLSGMMLPTGTRLWTQHENLRGLEAVNNALGAQIISKQDVDAKVNQIVKSVGDAEIYGVSELSMALQDKGYKLKRVKGKDHMWLASRKIGRYIALGYQGSREPSQAHWIAVDADSQHEGTSRCGLVIDSALEGYRPLSVGGILSCLSCGVHPCKIYEILLQTFPKTPTPSEVNL